MIIAITMSNSKENSCRSTHCLNVSSPPRVLQVAARRASFRRTSRTRYKPRPPGWQPSPMSVPPDAARLRGDPKTVLTRRARSEERAPSQIVEPGTLAPCAKASVLAQEIVLLHDQRLLAERLVRTRVTGDTRRPDEAVPASDPGQVGETLQNASPGDDRATAAEEGSISAGEADTEVDADNSPTSRSGVEVIVGEIPDATTFRSSAGPHAEATANTTCLVT